MTWLVNICPKGSAGESDVTVPPCEDSDKCMAERVNLMTGFLGSSALKSVFQADRRSGKQLGAVD